MTPAAQRAEKETNRLEAFSDGVFAIAITLLVLDLKVPHLEGAVTASELADKLSLQWPNYFALVTSFFTILVMWVHHHTILRMVHRADSRLLFANGFLLLLITVVPYPTAVLAEYLRTPAAPAAAATYSALFVLISTAFYLFVMAAFRSHTLSPHASHRQIARMRRNYRWGPPMYAAALIAAPFNALLSLGICTGLWIFWTLLTRRVCLED